MALFSKIIAKLRGGNVSAADWEELRATLIEADLGAAFSETLIATAKLQKSEDIADAMRIALTSTLSTSTRDLAKAAAGPTTILVVGVNGTGKTTSASSR